LQPPKQKQSTIMTDSSSDRSAAKRSLWDQNVQGLGNVLMNVRAAWYGDQAVFYTKERETLKKYLPPFYYGMAASVFLFVSFRFTGSHSVQQWRKRTWEQWRPKKKERIAADTAASSAQPSTTAPPSLPQPGMGYLETKRITEREKALQSMKLLTDFFVSISVGVSGTLFLLGAKKKHMRADYEEAPLAPGRSVVADQMCPSLLEMYHNNGAVRGVLKENGNGKDNIDVNIASFAKFVENCQKRADYEERIRREKGISKFEPVLVPYTGL
jgi:hypothetical protein